MGQNDVRQSALHFEAVKVSMSQDKNGIILRLNVHPNDCPKELHTDWVGSRYIIAMVKLTDDDKPDVQTRAGDDTEADLILWIALPQRRVL
jgi:hypothetical protein